MPKLLGVSNRRAVRAFERAGFVVKREGKHTIMSDGVRRIVIPRHDPVNAITMAAIVLDAGLSIEQFRRLL